MADRENLFVRTAASVDELTAGLAGLLGLERLADDEQIGADRAALRGRARTADGWLGFFVHPNAHVLVDPEPDEVQAIDSYALEIDIWYGGRNEEIQRREARIVLDLLAEGRPAEPMLLCHGLSELVAAYLPGAGLHDFPKDTSMDAPDLALWHPWVRGPE